MSDIWASIISFIILIVIYGYISSSKLSNYRKNKLRGKTTPIVPNSINPSFALEINNL